MLCEFFKTRWAVNLEQEIAVTNVRITNRADCCWENLSDFDVRVGQNLNEGGKRNPQCGATYTADVGAGETITVNCGSPLPGRFLTVSIAEAEGILNFCEVEVYGHPRKLLACSEHGNKVGQCCYPMKMLLSFCRHVFTAGS